MQMPLARRPGTGALAERVEAGGGAEGRVQHRGQGRGVQAARASYLVGPPGVLRGLASACWGRRGFPRPMPAGVPRASRQAGGKTWGYRSRAGLLSCSASSSALALATAPQSVERCRGHRIWEVAGMVVAISRSGSSPTGSTLGAQPSLTAPTHTRAEGVPVGPSPLHTHPAWFAACLWRRE